MEAKAGSLLLTCDSTQNYKQKKQVRKQVLDIGTVKATINVTVSDKCPPPSQNILVLLSTPVKFFGTIVAVTTVTVPMPYVFAVIIRE